MTDPRGIGIGTNVRLKKPHPCGSDAWEVTRMGMDVGLTCLGCGRRVRLPRAVFERRCKGVAEDGGPDGAG